MRSGRGDQLIYAGTAGLDPSVFCDHIEEVITQTPISEETQGLLPSRDKVTQSGGQDHADEEQGGEMEEAPNKPRGFRHEDKVAKKVSVIDRPPRSL